MKPLPDRIIKFLASVKWAGLCASCPDETECKVKAWADYYESSINWDECKFLKEITKNFKKHFPEVK